MGRIITALDVGTSVVRTVVAELPSQEGEVPRILGIGTAPATGLRRGIVIDLDSATSSIRHSIAAAHRASGAPIRSVWLAVGGAHVSVSSSRGVVAVSRADGEISPEDVRRAIDAAETFMPKNPNREVLHMLPRSFTVDNEPGIKDPIGMFGVRLEADVLAIECSAPFLKSLFKCVEGAGVKIAEYVFAPLAAARAVLDRRQRELGVILLDIGGGTASFAVFEEDTLIHAGVLPIGGGHITNDVAIGFRTHVDIAEQVKCAAASCTPDAVSKRENVRLADFPLGEELARTQERNVAFSEDAVYPRKRLAEIVEARMRDVFELLGKELKKIRRAQLLPAGVVLIGGSARTPGVVELSKRELRLPADMGIPHIFETDISKDASSSFAVVLGILQWVAEESDKKTLWAHRGNLLGLNHKWVKWFRSLLP